MLQTFVGAAVFVSALFFSTSIRRTLPRAHPARRSTTVPFASRSPSTPGSLSITACLLVPTSISGCDYLASIAPMDLSSTAAATAGTATLQPPQATYPTNYERYNPQKPISWHDGHEPIKLINEDLPSMAQEHRYWFTQWGAAQTPSAYTLLCGYGLQSARGYYMQERGVNRHPTEVPDTGPMSSCKLRCSTGTTEIKAGWLGQLTTAVAGA